MPGLVSNTDKNARPRPEASAPRVVIIGAGPAGLTAAYELTKSGVTSIVLEADSVVGGLSRTEVRDGWRFDIGGYPVFSQGQRGGDLLRQGPHHDQVLLPAPAG